MLFAPRVYHDMQNRVASESDGAWFGRLAPGLRPGRPVAFHFGERIGGAAMVVPSGFVPLLDAVSIVASGLDPDAVNAVKPNGVGEWDRIQRLAAAARPISRLPPPITPLGSTLDRVERVSSNYDRLSPPYREVVDRLAATARSPQVASLNIELPNVVRAWEEILERKKIAMEAARARLLQALADGALCAEGIANDGDMFPIPLKPWRASDAFAVLLSGSVSFVRERAFAKVTARVVLPHVDFQAWWAQAMPTKEAVSAGKHSDNDERTDKIKATPEEQLASARIWMKTNVVPGVPQKRDTVVQDCMDQTHCSYRAARAAWKALPPTLRGTRGRKKEEAGPTRIIGRP